MQCKCLRYRILSANQNLQILHNRAVLLWYLGTQEELFRALSVIVTHLPHSKKANSLQWYKFLAPVQYHYQPHNLYHYMSLRTNGVLEKYVECCRQCNEFLLSLAQKPRKINRNKLNNLQKCSVNTLNITTVCSSLLRNKYNGNHSTVLVSALKFPPGQQCLETRQAQLHTRRVSLVTTSTSCVNKV